MKKLLLLPLLILFSLDIFAQQTYLDSVSSDIAIHPNNFKLYKTQNLWNFLKLDTRNGKIWQVQFSSKADERFQSELNIESLNYDNNEIAGRYELHETQNIYTFILIDKLDGRVWQVQRSSDPKDRLILRIR